MIEIRTIVLVVTTVAFAGTAGTRVPAAEKKRPPASRTNPLLAPWPGPHGGHPPFDQVEAGHFVPAFEAAMTEARREAAAIAGSTAEPTFENTIAALEDSGRTFERVYEVYSAWSNAASTPAFEAVEAEMAPRLAAFWNELEQDEALFRRVAAVRRSAEREGSLTAEQRRLTARLHDRNVRNGAGLGAPEKARLEAIERTLASLSATFSQNVRADEKQPAVVLETEADLDGLPDSARSAAAAAAAARGLAGRWVVPNTRSAVADFLTYSARRDLRQKAWRSYAERGDHGDAHDNNAIAAEILALRAQKAALLGFPTFAHWKLADSMVGTPERAGTFLLDLWKPALSRARQEVAAMQRLADGSREPARIAAWDTRYYAEKARKASFDVDEATIRPYLDLERLREGLFWTAGELFGLAFSPATGVPTVHPDIRVYQVTRRADGRHVGLLYFDPFARNGKYNGGQTDVYRVQERFRRETTPLVSIAMPFVKPGPDQPALLGWRDAETLFHEFGHALQYLCSDVAYPSLSGGRVVSDYGEFSGELLERYLATPEILGRFARHHRTGEAMPPALVQKVLQASTVGQGLLTAGLLAPALVEMRAHLAAGAPVEPDAFERATLAEIGAPDEVTPTFRLPHFVHVFGSDAYAAGYYRYLWAEMLATDAFEAMRSGAGPYAPETAARLRAHIFAAGGAVDPLEGYRAFRGRDPETGALLRERGFFEER
ncbi:MAG: M3 family metallopeptidase [Vicinamibacteria bacterium]